MRGLVQLVRAPNPGPMTLEGTNTWVLGDPSAGPVAVVDPGPTDQGHLDAVRKAARDHVVVILLTHRHLDHAEAAATLAAISGSGVRAVDPAWQVGPDGLADGDVIALPGITLRTVRTPGHTDDSCCFLVEAPGHPARVLTGDTVLGRGTSVITSPDGNLGNYLASLNRLERLVAEAAVSELLPGHGPAVTDPAGWLDGYRRHRVERLAQVREARAAGHTTPAAIVARVYADVDRAVWPAAEQSVAAQLDYLHATEGD